MENFTPLRKSANRKKINKFLVIGNMFLVVLIAVIGFTFYNKTLVTTQQKAGFDCSDWSDARKCREERKEYEESGQADADKAAKKKKEQEERRMKEETYVPAGGCPGGYVSCDINGNRFCISNDGTEGGCNKGAIDRGITVQTGGGSTKGTGGWRCIVGKGKDEPYVEGQPCVERNSVETIGNRAVPNCFCGIIQIDNPDGGGTYQSKCGCNKQEAEAIASTTLIGTVIPTPTGDATSTSTPTPTIVPTLPEGVSPTDVLVTIPPTSIPTITPTPTITKLVCATKDCNETSRPCEPGNICIKANNGSNYCSNISLVDACKSNPTENACCKIVSPTEIIVAKTTTSPTIVVKLLQTGVAKSFMFLIPVAIMLIGLIL